ncbi:MAG: hypothetical protein ACTSRB_11995 [Candidatus Helarchaeota archaeon]
MTKDKNFKKMAKLAFEDKVKNIIFMMKFLDSKGGLEEVKELCHGIRRDWRCEEVAFTAIG